MQIFAYKHVCIYRHIYSLVFSAAQLQINRCNVCGLSCWSVVLGVHLLQPFPWKTAILDEVEK